MIRILILQVICYLREKFVDKNFDFEKNSWFEIRRQIRYCGFYNTLRKAIRQFVFFCNYKNQQKDFLKSYYTDESVSIIKGVDKQVDILLVFCPSCDVVMPPLGVSYLSGYLKSKGLRCFILDINIHLFNTVKIKEREWWTCRYVRYWTEENLFNSLRDLFQSKIDKFVDMIFSVDTKFIGFSVNFLNRLFTIEIIRRIRQRDKSKIIILGGPECFDECRNDRFPDEIVDIYIIGEGEETLFEVIDTYKKGGELKKISGAVIKNDDVFSDYIPREPIRNLDSLPFPDFEDFHLSLFTFPKLPLLLSRGCIGQCAFCSDRVMFNYFRCRSAENILSEINYLINNYGIYNFQFNDLTCNGNIEELELFCDLIVKSRLKIKWVSNAISRKEMTYELLVKMKKAGCSAIYYGLESGSNRILKKMGKLFTMEEAEKVLENTHKAGILATVNIIVGFPGETEEDFLETCYFLRKNRSNIYMLGSLGLCLARCGSDMERRPERYEIIVHKDRIKERFWRGRDGNTFSLREERLNRIKLFISQIGLEYCQSVADVLFVKRK